MEERLISENFIRSSRVVLLTDFSHFSLLCTPIFKSIPYSIDVLDGSHARPPQRSCSPSQRSAPL